MMLRKLGAGFAVAAVALVGSLGSATADGMPGRGYGGACCLSWTGFYVGAHLGYGRSEVDWANVSLTGEPVHNDGRGFLGGGQIGFNWQSGNVVFGVEGTLSRTNIDDDYRSVVVPAAVTYSTDINWIGTVAGRLGFASGPALVYVKAGWATANVQLSGVQTAIPDAFSRDDRRNGWVVGGGFEYLFTRNLSFGARVQLHRPRQRQLCGLHPHRPPLHDQRMPTSKSTRSRLGSTSSSVVTIQGR